MKSPNPDWTEKFRPRLIDDVVLPEGLKTRFKKFVEDGDIPNLLLTGKAGSGKTTIALAAMDELECDYIKINGSLEGNIDTLRTKITDFATSISFSGKKKMVLLDEADHLNIQSTQPALRNFMESYSKNCFHRSTKILTLEFGSIEIGDIVGKEVTVKSKDGIYRKVKVSSYGKAELYEYKFGKHNSTAKNYHLNVIATKNHRWFLSNGTITTNLSLKDRLLNPVTSVNKDLNGIIHGMIFGDGSGHKSSMRGDVSYVRPQGKYATIRVCKQDMVQKEMIEHLVNAGYTPRYPNHTNGDAIFALGFMPYIKDLPFTTDPNYIAGFIYGWWLADGRKDNRDRLLISTIQKDAVDWLKEYASYAGFRVTGLNVRINRKGVYDNAKPLYMITLSNNQEAVVRDIKYFGTDEVFCVEEPVTSGFVLSNGLLTGNCGFLLTANYKKKLMPELLSRCSVVDFNIKKSERPKIAMGYLDSLTAILDKENIPYDKKVLADLIMVHFPDLRRVIHECQTYSKMVQIDAGILGTSLDVNFKELIGYLKTKNFRAMRKWVSENYDADPLMVMRKIYDDCYDILKPGCIPSIIVVIAEYQYKHSFVADGEVNLVACLTQIMADGIWL
jgi:DNA polymerase III delta prime subunit